MAAVALALITVPAFAHESRPLYVQLRQLSVHEFQLQWKIPPSVSPSNAPMVTLTDGCRARGQLMELNRSGGMVRRLTYGCEKEAANQGIVITYSQLNPAISTLIRYSTRSGQRHTAVLGPEQSYWPIPAAESAQTLVGQYALLGTEHILAGVDHLLFVLCLLWIAGTWRRILITISGFTVGHSATLALSTLQFVRVPIPPVEAANALSIMFLATEIAKGPRRSLTWQYPVAVSTSFGLLHGFGFAAALREIGLPQQELAVALLSFNAGVEIGQVMFAGGVIVLSIGVARLRGVGRLSDRRSVFMARTVTSYGVGAIAALWLIERCAAF